MIDDHTYHSGMALKEPNSWSTRRAAEWANVNERVLSDLFERRLLPAIRVGAAQDQRMANGKKRKRRVGKWIVPREAFIRAWQTFTVPDQGTSRKRRTAA
jgi:hypothetical protein